MNTVSKLAANLLSALDGIPQCPKMYGRPETIEFTAIHLWCTLESLYRGDIPRLEQASERWHRFVSETYPKGCVFLHTYLSDRYEEEEVYRRLVEQIVGFRSRLILVEDGVTETDQAHNAFRAGLEAAAKWHEERAGAFRQRHAHLESNPQTVPDDIRYTLLEDFMEDAQDETNTAFYIRRLPVPSDFRTAGEVAMEALRATYEAKVAEVNQNRDLARARAARLDEENKTLRAELATLRENQPKV